MLPTNMVATDAAATEVGVTVRGSARSTARDRMNEDRLSAEADAAAAPDHGSRRGVANDGTLVRGILIGYARCSTERQDLTAQRRT